MGNQDSSARAMIAQNRIWNSAVTKYSRKLLSNAASRAAASGGEDGAPNAHHRGPLLHRDLIIVGHAHRQLHPIHGTPVLQCVAPLAEAAKDAARGGGLEPERCDGHEPLHLDVRQD